MRTAPSPLRWPPPWHRASRRASATTPHAAPPSYRTPPATPPPVSTRCRLPTIPLRRPPLRPAHQRPRNPSRWTRTVTACPTPGRSRLPASPARMAPSPVTATATASRTKHKLPSPPPTPSPPSPAPGDGNGDGISEKTQSAVASTETVTLVAGSRDGKLGPDSLARITSLEHKAAPAQLPPEMEMPVGLLSFSAAPGAAGRSESFSLYVDPAQGANGYWIEDDTGIWVNLASAPYGGKMVTEGGRLRLDFQIEDGGRVDGDGKAEGGITRPGAAAYMPLSIIGKRSEDQALDFWF